MNNRFWFQVSPQKRLSGAFVITRPAGAIAIQVLPRLWTAPTARTVIHLESETTADVILYEQDYFTIPNEWIQVRDALLGAPSFDTESGLTESVRATPLVKAVAPQFRNDISQGPAPETAAVQTTHLRSLWVIAAELDQASPTGCVRVPGPGWKEDWSRQVGAVAQQLPQLRSYLATRFIIEMRDHATHLRRSYRRRQETLPAVRGRIVPATLAHRAARNSVDIDCSYDEFSADSPLSRVLRAALNVAIGLASSRYQQEAAGLVRLQLTDVQTVPIRAAAHLARTVRITRAGRALQPALELARALLRSVDSSGIDDDAQNNERSGVLTQIGIGMDRLWEIAVCQLIDGEDHPSPATAAPFVGLGRPPAVDIGHAKHGLIDCKYKTPEIPSTDDVNQIYVYLDLYGERHATLAYPVALGTSAEPPKIYPHSRDDTAKLRVVRLPFIDPTRPLKHWFETTTWPIAETSATP